MKYANVCVGDYAVELLQVQEIGKLLIVILSLRKITNYAAMIRYVLYTCIKMH